MPVAAADAYAVMVEEVSSAVRGAPGWVLPLEESRATLSSLGKGPIQEPDANDRASSETDWGIELRTRDRQRKLISKIDSALKRIDGGDYGYCDITGEPIGLPRLEARPVATMTLEAQERHERAERVSRDD